MTENTEKFNHRSENYAKARPGYAAGAAELLASLIPADAAVADIGCGTGIFTRELLARGYTVYGVEPNAEMRAHAEAAFAEDPAFHAVPAAAEATGLPAESLDAVTAASAFHWFDADAFFAECRRILKPGGILFTVCNARDYRDDFTQAQHALYLELCPAYTSMKHGLEESVPRLERLLGPELHKAEFDFPLTYTKENFLRRSLSSSYAPEPGTPEAERYVSGLRALLEAYYPGCDSITVPNLTAVYWGRAGRA